MTVTKEEVQEALQDIKRQIVQARTKKSQSRLEVIEFVLTHWLSLPKRVHWHEKMDGADTRCV